MLIQWNLYKVVIILGTKQSSCTERWPDSTYMYVYTSAKHSTFLTTCLITHHIKHYKCLLQMYGTHMANKMASQVTAGASWYKKTFYISSYHEQQSMWRPTVGETLLVETESMNPHYHFGVAVTKESRTVYHFLKSEGVAFCEVTSAINFRVWLG